MTLYLRQSTAIDIRMGPFVDVGDGFTPETGVTTAGSDEAEVLKADGAATSSMSGSFVAVTACDGWYDYTTTALDTDTVGEVVFVMQDDSVYLPVFVRAYVLEEAIYDSLFDGGSAAFDASDRVTVGALAANVITTASINDAAITLAKLAAACIDDTKLATGVITAAKMAANCLSASLCADNLPVDILAINAQTAAAANLQEAWQNHIVKATCNTAGATSTTTPSDLNTTGPTETTDDHYNNRTLVFTSGNLAGVAVFITDYTGSSGLLTHTPTPTGEAAANTDTIMII